MPPDHMSPDTYLADFDTQFERFAVNPWRTPQRVGDAHLPDQLTNLAIHARPAGALRSRPPAPISAEVLPVPVEHRCRFDQLHHLQAARPNPVEPSPQ